MASKLRGMVFYQHDTLAGWVHEVVGEYLLVQYVDKGGLHFVPVKQIHQHANEPWVFQVWNDDPEYDLLDELDGNQQSAEISATI